MFPTFSEFFADVTGHDPFPWQNSLAEHVQVEGSWPDTVAVPTGLGKTAVMLISVYELARQLAYGEPRTAPLRTFLMVDRRMVVDQAALTAQRIERAFTDPTCSAAARVHRVLRESFGTVPGSDGAVLATTRIHGGIGRAAQSRGWLYASHPALVSLTPHQFVSRLLGRGYGVSPGVAPIHMGLTGMDSLVLVDEPHLSVPAIATIRGVSTVQEHSQWCGVAPVRAVLLGATVPPGVDVGTKFGTTEADLDHPVAGRRLTAEKWVELRSSSKSDTSYTATILAAVGAVQQGERVGIVVNTIGLARTVRDSLSKQGLESALITSRMRGVDRERLNEMILAGAGPQVVVSTQTIEAGVDVSFDRLITEIAPYPSLVQRLGRLNRSADASSAEAVIVVPPVPESGKAAAFREASLFIYDEARLEASLELLRSVASSGRVNLSLVAQRDIGTDFADQVVRCWPEAPPIPSLVPATMRTITQTRPRPSVDIDVDTFVTGIEEEKRSADVQVAWRDFVDARLLEECPIQPGETVSIPVAVARAFIAGFQPLPVGDEVSAPMSARKKLMQVAAPRTGLTQVNGEWEALTARNIRPGSVLVMPCSQGGYDEYGWSAASVAPVNDVSRELLLSAGRYAPLGAKELGADFIDALEDRSPDECSDLLPESLRAAISGSAEGDVEWAPQSFEVDGEVVLLARRRTVVVPSLGGRVTLADHLADVSERARASSDAIGLSAELGNVLAWAGYLHDTGKEDPRFQQALDAGPDVMAKSLRPMTLSEILRRRRAVRLPEGWRHEAASAADAIESGASSLLVHLIAAHHGWARPGFLPADSAHQAATRVDAFHSLNGQLGPWGLAYLEAILRGADWEASAYPRSGRRRPPTETFPLGSLEPSDGDQREIRLQGLPLESPLEWWAAFGVLCTASQIDPSATIRWEDRVPVLRSLADLSQVSSFARDFLTEVTASGLVGAKNHNVALPLSGSGLEKGILIRLGVETDPSRHRLKEKLTDSETNRVVAGEGATISRFCTPWHPNNGNVWGKKAGGDFLKVWDPDTVTAGPESWRYVAEPKIPSLSPETTSAGHSTGEGRIISKAGTGVGGRFDVMMWAGAGVALEGWAFGGRHLGDIAGGSRLPVPYRDVTMSELIWLMQTIPVHREFFDIPVLEVVTVSTPNGKARMNAAVHWDCGGYRLNGRPGVGRTVEGKSEE